MNTPKYWDDRYKTGLGAGNGSRGRLYEFKLEQVQKIVDDYKVKSVVDVGCADGNQMMSLKVGKYTGLDISPVAISIAEGLSSESRTYSVIDAKSTAKSKIADMAISLDVIMHLPDDQYQAHLDLLFRLAKKYVLIYAPNMDGEGMRLASHMCFHEFVQDIKEVQGLEPILTIPNLYPVVGGAAANNTSYSEFYLFEKRNKKEVNDEKKTI